MDARGFAYELLAELRRHDPKAAELHVQTKGSNAVIGIYDDEFVPLLRLTRASAKFNVMTLLVHHHGKWNHSFKRGTPKEIAAPLAGELNHI